jgi:hypothetical protein
VSDVQDIDAKHARGRRHPRRQFFGSHKHGGPCQPWQ